MLKDILLKTAELINRDDLIESLNKQNNPSQSIQNDISRMISYFNYTMETLCDNYYNLKHSQNIYSNNNKKISYLNFTYEPTKILKVSKNGRPVFFSEYSKYITVPEGNSVYEVTYKFLPDRVTDLNQEINLPRGVTQKMVCYGIAHEFLASKNQESKAEYWKNKFMFEIFKSKTSQDRRLKPSFLLWKQSIFFTQTLNMI